MPSHGATSTVRRSRFSAAVSRVCASSTLASASAGPRRGRTAEGGDVGLLSGQRGLRLNDLRFRLFEVLLRGGLPGRLDTNSLQGPFGMLQFLGQAFCLALGSLDAVRVHPGQELLERGPGLFQFFSATATAACSSSLSRCRIVAPFPPARPRRRNTRR